MSHLKILSGFILSFPLLVALCACDKENREMISKVAQRELNAMSNQVKSASVVKDCADCPEMLVIPAGSFQMGASESDVDSLGLEKPRHTVTLNTSFALARTPVTQGQWRALMGNNPSRFSSCGDTCPVEQVSWYEAKSFVLALNAKTGKSYRLPSESEWEYACQAEGKHKFCGSDDANEVAWYKENGGGTPHPVGQKAPNSWGLHDLSGNVFEWVEDCTHYNYSGNQPTDGSARTDECTFRGMRGGSWDREATSTRVTSRAWMSPKDRRSDVGFRLAKTFP